MSKPEVEEVRSGTGRSFLTLRGLFPQLSHSLIELLPSGLDIEYTMLALEIAVAEAMHLDGQRTITEDLGLSNCARNEIAHLRE